MVTLAAVWGMISKAERIQAGEAPDPDVAGVEELGPAPSVTPSPSPAAG
jgi:hypothetical protein